VKGRCSLDQLTDHSSDLGWLKDAKQNGNPFADEPARRKSPQG